MKQQIIRLLQWSQKYTQVDMVYLASGAFWGNINSLFLAFLSFIVSILFARFLTQEQYGTYQYILALSGIIGALTLTGMNAAVTRAIARGYEGDFKKSVLYQLKLGLIPTIVALAISGWYFFKGNTDLSTSVLWIGLLLPTANAFNTWALFYPKLCLDNFRKFPLHLN
jgi:O-antigen/teichoic acid export membrane protein